ncbi:membrane transporter [Talaromyces pinophilus]|uniref:Membrane transporter n=1 Tax=Talaromyces pinophilus TaxID=128442 RepID=A0A6V8HF45_TALPI|nr:Efflux pump vrtL [Talaromyces pinophilus]GAM39746.1 membrane transporter [Talaromyces pinophilus]
MADMEKVASAASRRSDLSRVYSAPHMDNQTAFYATSKEEDGRETDSVVPSYTARDDDNADLENGSGSSDGHDDDLQPTQSSRSRRSERDPKLVTWKGPDDPEDPKNWSMRRRWAAVFVVSCYTFLSPVSSSMVAPGLTAIAKDLNITNEVELEMTLSIFVLAYSIGPLFLGPLSEIYGRAIVLQLANLFFLVFNIACGVAQTKAQMIVFRFLSGLGGSAPLSIGGGVMSDCFRAEERGRAVSIYSLAPLLGPAVGPIAGGFIAQNTTWRWCFYSTSILTGVIQFAGLFILQETYGPALLHRKAKKLRKETQDPSWHTEYEDANRTFTSLLSTSLRRPFILLATQPIVQVLALFMAYIYGLMYLMLASFPGLWTGVKYYHESVGIGGLNYISLGFGFFLGSQISARLIDLIYRKLKARNGGVGAPEFRTPLLLIGALAIPTGLFIYGWTAQSRTHWIGPNIGAAIFSVGAIISFQCIQTYLVDAYTRYAASALAAVTVLRSLAGFSFPLFAQYMYNALDYGWGNSLLAFVGIGIGIPAPLLLWKYGAKLRAMSPFAAG